MEMVSVESSNLKAIGYEESQRVLYVEFLKSGTYKYLGVEKSVYEGFFDAESIGKYFDQNIKKADYEFSKV